MIDLLVAKLNTFHKYLVVDKTVYGFGPEQRCKYVYYKLL